MSALIRITGLGVRFQFDRQGRPVTPAAARIRRHCTSAWGLRGVGLEIASGECVALIGPNGAGKTTLLRAIAGVLAADEGSLEVQGRLGPLLSVDAGLVRLLTGRESCRLLCTLAGMPRARVRTLLAELPAESGLAESFDHPVSSYSQGMRARLGFTAISHTEPEILLLDEVHEALDREFRELLAARVRKVAQGGGIVLAAGHDHEELGGLASRAVLLEDGSVSADGPFAEVAHAYFREGARVATGMT
ncbi:MAG: ABC transporter ATP-binding protein [Solirubrobacteraceae bacterium]